MAVFLLGLSSCDATKLGGMDVVFGEMDMWDWGVCVTLDKHLVLKEVDMWDLRVCSTLD